MSTLESIQARIEALQAKADALIAKKSESVLKKIHDLMSSHGLTVSDIEQYSGTRKKTGKSTAAKKQGTVAYQDPKTGATWSGRGRAPGWIANARDRSKFAVGASAPANKAKGQARAAVKRKAKGQPRGPQPAVYRDPQSGATWSGRGRAPAWLASVEDRTPFLIG
ncbi:H-NS family nucleoid-associated regulatory protein [Caballeronia sp. INDeC2]|uniref:H-NS family nucleoid-associated regulatory protein n=1 Tax=Caballeronia sp. INDeC2 TaxID=2921747 RepID=UPI00202838B2|nr:H-NS family nucleoid-associated regulatory protein [Caballeronia sp. INDeC2]